MKKDQFQSKPESPEEQAREGLAAVNCSPLPDQRVVTALDWLLTTLNELETAISEVSPDCNSAQLICCRAALRKTQSHIKPLIDLSAVCQANGQGEARR